MDEADVGVGLGKVAELAFGGVYLRAVGANGMLSRLFLL